MNPPKEFNQMKTAIEHYDRTKIVYIILVIIAGIEVAYSFIKGNGIEDAFVGITLLLMVAFQYERIHIYKNIIAMHKDFEKTSSN